MSIHHRPPDAEVLFTLSASTMEGEVKHVLSGYRPIYDACPEFWTSTHHEFIDTTEVSTGQSARANVWFLSPEHYPHSLWVGRVLSVAEGSRVVGSSMIVKVLNGDLLKDVQPCDDQT